MPVRSLTEALPAAWARGEVSVIGLARSGRAVAELLRRAGADVYASDITLITSTDSNLIEPTRRVVSARDLDIY